MDGAESAEPCQPCRAARDASRGRRPPSLWLSARVGGAPLLRGGRLDAVRARPLDLHCPHEPPARPGPPRDPAVDPAVADAVNADDLGLTRAPGADRLRTRGLACPRHAQRPRNVRRPELN